MSRTKGFVNEGIIVPIPDFERIISGETITDMGSTVKELIDNALDAGATVINIRLFNQGVDVIEVSDNGCGIPLHSRPLMAMNHATSKIRVFDDLVNDTYDTDGKIQQKQLGFRGEALFSITNMCQSVIIATRTKTDKVGQKLEFRRDGYLNPNSMKNIERKVGTTVAVVNLFDTVPVRRADMMKQIKAQRSSMFQLIQSYAILCVGVRFNVTDISGPQRACKSEVKLNTSERSNNIKDTVSAVFGSNFLSVMCPIQVDLTCFVASLNMQAAANVEETKNNSSWKIEGLVSTAPNACNNNNRDVQFFSINGRPVECPQITKVMFAVWNNFESSCLQNGSGERQEQRPSCILRLFLPSKMIDVNLSPNKRQVLITEETAICEMFRESLNNLWFKQTDGSFKANEFEVTKNLNGGNLNRVSRPLEDNIQNSHLSGNIETKGRKMRRRNGFYLDPYNIGTMAPDAEYDEKKNFCLPQGGNRGDHGDMQQDNVSNASLQRTKDPVPDTLFSARQGNDLQIEGSSINTSSFQSNETREFQNGNNWTHKRSAAELSEIESKNSSVQRWNQNKLEFNTDAQHDDNKRLKYLPAENNEELH